MVMGAGVYLVVKVLASVVKVLQACIPDPVSCFLLMQSLEGSSVALLMGPSPLVGELLPLLGSWLWP